MTKTFLFRLFTLFISLNLYSQNSYVFVGSYNSDKNKAGIYVFQLDTITGNLKKFTTVKNILNPSFLTVSPNGKYVFACTETKTPNAGSVSSFEFNRQDKTLTFINSQRSGGENPVYLSVHKNGKWLVNANYTEASVSVFSIAENGIINPITQVFSYSEGSINKERQERSHVHSAVFSPNYDFIFSPDLGADKIRCFQFDSLQKKPLKEMNPTFFSAALGSGPRHFVFHPNGKWAYCIEELAGSVSAYKYDKGKLENIQRIEAHSEVFKERFASGDIHISPDGHFLYASNRGEENNIAIFSIAKDGTLKTIGYQSTFGKTPRIFAIDSTGKFLVVANQSTGNIVVFIRDSITGLLKKTGNKVKVANASYVQIKEYM